jgi:hypothetical protein
MKPQRLLLPILCGTIALTLAASPLRQSQATPATPIVNPTPALSPTLAAKVTETMAGAFGADRKAFSITKTTPSN